MFTIPPSLLRPFYYFERQNAILSWLLLPHVTTNSSFPFLPKCCVDSPRWRQDRQVVRKEEADRPGWRNSTCFHFLSHPSFFCGQWEVSLLLFWEETVSRHCCAMKLHFLLPISTSCFSVPSLDYLPPFHSLRRKETGGDSPSSTLEEKV